MVGMSERYDTHCCARVRPEILGLASNGQVVFSPCSARSTRLSPRRSRLCQLTTVMRRVRSVAFHRSGRRTRSSKIGPVRPHARVWANLRTGHAVLPDLAVRAVSLS